MKKRFDRRPDRGGQGGHGGNRGGSNQGKWNKERFFEKKRRLERERRVPGGEESDKPRNAETRWIGGLDAAVAAIAKSPYDCRELWIEHELSNPNVGALINSAKIQNIPVRYMSRPELDRAVKGGKHGGVALRQTFDPSSTFGEWIAGLDDERKKGMVIVVLDQIQDPHNLGAIARSALQLFARCVVIPERRSAPVTPAVIQASAGAALKIPIHRVVNVAQTLELCKKHGFWVYGADAAGKDAWDATINTPCALVIGSEGYGMRPLVRASCDELMRVPQAEHGVGSLNASCAATALLYEISRQNRKPAA